ncbi:MAG: hypothetical protein BXU00_00470 [Candidatus Nanoclepta minutus]|uniref:HEPN domain-containing protein n=1 Tax=Candidatus Nanoclepta minutus TaxID=1940235 RepID=A0A397WQ04_9ARCH|nr:MAG: hypothetical protein BXU00_00470 [Candidatus Nanoclepta minutus]
MIDFDFYIRKGIVVKRIPDKNRARDLLSDSEEKFMIAEKVKDISPKVAFELYYDAIRGLLEVGMFIYGYKTWSHEAAISFGKILGLKDEEISFLDNLRKLRNESKYYGGKIDRDLLDGLYRDIVEVYNKLKGILLKLIDQN